MGMENLVRGLAIEIAPSYRAMKACKVEMLLINYVVGKILG